MREEANIKAARRLRRDANAPESIAWSHLRKLRKHGVSVRRQHTVGPFVVDFAIVRANLVLEIDGGVHRLPAVRARDEVRQRELEALGWRVVRIPPEVAMSGDALMALVQREIGM